MQCKRIKALQANDTWNLIELPKCKNAIPDRWVYKIKTLDEKSKYKARWLQNAVYTKRDIDGSPAIFGMHISGKNRSTLKALNSS